MAPYCGKKRLEMMVIGTKIRAINQYDLVDVNNHPVQ